jgi:hypothetical protein
MTFFAIGLPGNSPRIIHRSDGNDNITQIQSGEVAIEVPDIGDYLISTDGVTISNRPKTLDELKNGKLKELIVEYNSRSSIWVGYSSAGVQLDKDSRETLSQMVSLVQISASVNMFSPVKWKMADNTICTFNDSDSFLTMALGAGFYWQECFWKYQNLKDAIASSSEEYELNNINLVVGWPT